MEDKKPGVLGVGYVCATCRFSIVYRADPTQIKPTRICKRHPPPVVMVPTGPQTAQVQSVVRPVQDTEWCFDYQPTGQVLQAEG